MAKEAAHHSEHSENETPTEKKGLRLRNPTRLSTRSLLIFILVFGAIGGYLIWKSFAASVVTWGSFEAGNLSEYSDTSCPLSVGKPNAVTVVTSPVRQGKYAGFFQTDSATHCYGDNNNVRLHMLGFKPGAGIDMNNGSTFWWTVSLRIPSSNTNNGDFTLPEIHQDSGGTTCKGPAPFNFASDNWRWKLIIRGYGSCGSSIFISHIFGAPNSTCNSTDRICHNFAGGISPNIQADQWYDFMLGWHMATDNTGWFEGWMNGPGTNGKSVNIIPRINAPTTYSASNYPMNSMYYPTSSALTKAYYDGGAFSTDFATLRDWQNSFTNSWGTSTTTPPPPPPTTTPTSKPTIPTGLSATPGNGQVSLSWNANPTSDQVDTYQVYLNGANYKLDVSGTSFTVPGLTNGTSYGFRVSAHNSLGYGGWTDAVNATPVATTQPPPPPPTTSTNGLNATYFNNISLSGTPVLTRVDPNIFYNWAAGTSPGPGVNGSQYSIRWTGKLKADTTGTYTIGFNSDDGVRVYINNTLVINNWTDHSATVNTGTINLTEGQTYPITVEYYNNQGEGWARLNWTVPQPPSGPVPSTSLLTL